MSNLRTGTYGQYYGSYYNESKPLTHAQMEVNATYLYKAFTAHSWTINAISAILGNMQAESSINPGRWQSDSVNWTAGGYGLVQWTPTTKYINWCTSKGYSDPSEIDHNVERIIWEVSYGDQWSKPSYSPYSMTFKQFTTSTDSVETLTKAFLLNYEKPAEANRTPEKQAMRASYGVAWYTYLSGQSPPTPDPEPDPENPIKINPKFKFVLFGNQSKRRRVSR